MDSNRKVILHQLPHGEQHGDAEDEDADPQAGVALGRHPFLKIIFY